jgi:hypothetical protein
MSTARPQRQQQHPAEPPPQNPDVLDWNDQIENEGNEFELLPEGTEVEFTVAKFEQGWSDKKGCPMASLTLTCTDAEGRNGRVYENILLHKTSEWRLCAFFVAIGLRKHGEAFAMGPAWKQVPGAKGMAVLTIEPAEGRYPAKNKVKKYLDPVDTTPEQGTTTGGPSFA